jgi:hypothetical protein
LTQKPGQHYKQQPLKYDGTGSLAEAALAEPFQGSDWVFSVSQRQHQPE